MGIHSEALPSTFRDAVKITRMLGLRYLWIDSLCILQDEDKKDWEQESSQMEKVYGGAELVLAAAVASSPTDGFLRDRPGNLSGHTSVSLVPKGTLMNTSYRLMFQDVHMSGVDGPLERRSWAFQEKLLARRYLAYGPDEMRWECSQDSFCECGWISAQPPGFHYERNLDSTLKSVSYPLWVELWAKAIVQPYTTKKLTVQSDKLVALSAVASRFQSKRGGTYLAGLWREGLIYLLSWLADCGSPQSFYAPSWSWASIDDTIAYPKYLVGEPMLANVLDYSVVLSTANKFGPVSSGKIKLSGKAIRATLCVGEASHRGPRGEAVGDMANTWVEVPESKNNPCRLDMPIVAHDYIVDNTSGKTEPSARRVFYDEKHGLYPNIPGAYSIWLLPLIKDRRSAIFALILGRSPKHTGCFERIGYVFVETKSYLEAKELLAKYEDDEFTIV